MCGIVGYIGPRDAAPILMQGLHRLEYRGYDSAGLVVARSGKLRMHKSKGKVRELESKLPEKLRGGPGIAHTRWATHGEPSDRNAHPHSDAANRYAIVHNGIIENAAELRARLEAQGVVFQSQTDSEVLAHLIAAMPADTLEDRVRAALRLVTGTYGLAVLDAESPKSIVVARNGSPVILGLGDDEMFVASDAAALASHTRSIVHLDDGELAVLRADGYEASTLAGGATQKTPLTIDWASEALDKGSHAHYMRKEMAEQADAIRRTLGGRLEPRFQTTRLGGLEDAARELLEVRRVKILGCGSAHIAGSMGAQLIEQLARVPAHAEPASEFRYRNPVIESDTLYVAVSQSGETFDTLAAIQEVKRKGGRVLGHRQRRRQHASRASAAAASICTRARRSRSWRPRRSRAPPSRSRCSPSTWAACEICRPRAARGSSPRSKRYPGRCSKSWTTKPRSRRLRGRSPRAAMSTSSAAPPASPSRSRAR